MTRRDLSSKANREEMATELERYNRVALLIEKLKPQHRRTYCTIGLPTGDNLSVDSAEVIILLERKLTRHADNLKEFGLDLAGATPIHKSTFEANTPQTYGRTNRPAAFDADPEDEESTSIP